jgi:hypothetical protein
MLPAAGATMMGIMTNKQRKGRSALSGMWANMGSTIATFMFAWTIIRQYCPLMLNGFFEKYTRRLMGYFYPYLQISFHEFRGGRFRSSEAYAAIKAYLSANSTKNAKRLKGEMGKDISSLVLSMDEYETVTDEFQGAEVWWLSEKRHYAITFHKKYREIITESYLEHVLSKGKEIISSKRQR